MTTRRKLVLALLCGVFGYFALRLADKPALPEENARQTSTELGAGSRELLRARAAPGEQGPSAAGTEERSDRVVARVASPARLDSGAASRDPAPESESRSGSPSRGSTLHKRSSSVEGGPSIGEVRVLGHRGCDVNTPGWFLSVGNPEQYDFNVSDDGETLVISPNQASPTGNFEFVHCADVSQLVGRRVRLAARIKSQDVTKTAQLRLRAENVYREKIAYDDVKVGGTHDWKDFSVELDVGPEVTLFSYGLTFKSKGKLWMNHPTFEILK